MSPHTHIELEHAMPEIDSGARGSTYLVQEKYVDRKQGMPTLAPLVRALRPL